MSETEKKHAEMVRALLKSGEEIMKEMTPMKANLLHIGLGLSGEVGELVDAIKKHAIYNQPLDFDNVIEELGDLEFFVKALQQALLIGRQRILDANIAKLAERYGDKYSDEAAKARKDKQA